MGLATFCIIMRRLIMMFTMFTLELNTLLVVGIINYTRYFMKATLNILLILNKFYAFSIELKRLRIVVFVV